MTTARQKHTASKHRKRVLIVLAVLSLVVIIPTTALAYVGFVPVLTPLLKSNQPVDLGVEYSAADFRSLQQKAQLNVGNFDQTQGLSQDIEKTAPGKQLVLYGAVSNQTTLTQQELTAFINMMPWTNSPLSNAQIRLSNGAFEFSGNIKSAYISDLIKTAYAEADYGGLNPALKLAARLYDPAVYIKANISATNVNSGPARGQLILKITALKVNRFDLSSDVSNMNEIKVTIPEGSHEQGTPYSVSTLSVLDGSLDVYGTLPTSFNVGNGDPAVICTNNHGTSIVSLNTVNGRIGSTTKYCQ